jgi:hypothetical protein
MSTRKYSPKKWLEGYIAMAKAGLERLQEMLESSKFLGRIFLIDNYGVQLMYELSPPKWNLAHTSWLESKGEGSANDFAFVRF